MQTVYYTLHLIRQPRWLHGFSIVMGKFSDHDLLEN